MMVVSEKSAAMGTMAMTMAKTRGSILVVQGAG